LIFKITNASTISGYFEEILKIIVDFFYNKLLLY